MSNKNENIERNEKIEKNVKKRKKKSNPLTPAIVILALLAFMAIVLCVVMGVVMLVKDGASLFEKKSEVVLSSEEDPIPVTYTQAEVDEMVQQAEARGEEQKEIQIKGMIREEAESSNPSFANLLRKMYPECMVYSGDGRFYFQDIDPTIPANPYARENFITDDSGFRYYSENGAKNSILCIDVSSHQGAIDWPKVATSGVGSVMIRAGYRGYGSGKMVEDEQVLGNIMGAQANGIEAGIYYFSQAINEVEIEEEVQALLDIARENGVTGPIAIDVEKLDAATARGNALSADERTRLTVLFCEKITAAGYEPMIYGNAYSLFHMLNYKEICNYPIWYAFYSDFQYFPYECSMWQYSSTGKVPGISGNVDLNVKYVPASKDSQG